MQIIEVKTREDLELVRELFRDYERFIGVSLDFQNFEEELNKLPGRYAAPRGRLLLAKIDDEAAGCIAFYPMGDEVAEIKRFYVTPSYTSRGIGTQLFERALEEIAKAHYEYVRLDSLRRLSEAAKFYEKYDFYEIEPYNVDPHEDVYYLEMKLSKK